MGRRASSPGLTGAQGPGALGRFLHRGAQGGGPSHSQGEGGGTGPSEPRRETPQAELGPSGQRGHKPVTSMHREGEWRPRGRVRAPEGDGRGGWTEAPGGAGASEGAVPGARMQGPSFKGRGRRLGATSIESRVEGLLFSGDVAGGSGPRP